MSVEPGSKAPEFTLPASGGSEISLAALKGKKVALFFYPKASTSGCTVEAKDFSRLKADFAAANTEVIGMSPDAVKAQDKFVKGAELTVPLASDTEKAVLEAYGVWVEKSMYGRKYMGVERSTFLIDANGTIAKAWRKVSVPGHAEEVLAAAKAL